MKKHYKDILTDIKATGNINGVPWAFGRYKHFVPRCENVLIVGNIIFPIVDGVTEDIVTELVTDLVTELIEKGLINHEERTSN